MDTTTKHLEDHDASTWLDMVFRDRYAASWLMNKEPIIDTDNTTHMNDYFMGAHTFTTTQSEATNMFHDTSHGYNYYEGSSTTNRPLQTMPLPPPPTNCDTCDDSFNVVYKCHENLGTSCLLSVTSTAIPFEFLEPATTPKYQVHRAHCFITSTELVMCECMWLADTTSFILVSRYPFHETSKKYMVRIRGYDSDSPPRNYELESAVWYELQDCQYCIFRGAEHCCCSPSSMNRMRPILSLTAINRASEDQQDAWTVWQWVFTNYDSMIKKYRVHVYNHALQISTETEVYSRTLPCTQDHGNSALALRIYQEHAIAPGKSVSDKPTCRLSFSLPIDEALNDNEWRDWLPSANTSMKVSSVTANTEADLSSDDHGEPNHKSQNHNSAATMAILDNEAQPKKKRPRIKQDPLDEKTRACVIEYYIQVSDMVWTPEQQAECELCGLKYVRKFDLKRHVKAAHLMDRDFGCMLCDKKFKRQEHLTAHIVQIHKDDVS